MDGSAGSEVCSYFWSWLYELWRMQRYPLSNSISSLDPQHYPTQLAFNVVSMMIMKIKYTLQTRSVQNGQTPALYPIAPCQTWLVWNSKAAGLILRVLLHQYVCPVVFHMNLRRVSSTPSVSTRKVQKRTPFSGLLILSPPNRCNFITPVKPPKKSAITNLFDFITRVSNRILSTKPLYRTRGRGL
jgi:hypothetical protein